MSTSLKKSQINKLSKRSKNSPKGSYIDSKSVSETTSLRSQSDFSDSDLNDLDDEDLFMYHTFKTGYQLKVRPSILDDQSPNSRLSKSLFRGFYNLMMIFSFLMLVNLPLQRYISSGQFIQPDLLDNIKTDFFLMIITWPMFYLWAHTALILQYLSLSGLPEKILFFLQHSTQVMMFAYCNYIVLTRNWCSTHTGFVTILSCVMFMKMHSYTTVNSYFRKDYLKCQKDKNRKPFSNYPKNINLREFTLFMWMPTLTYEISYPRNDRVNIWYIIKKSMITLMSMMGGYIVLSDYIIPSVEKGEKITPYELIARLVLPLLLFTIVVVFILWECILNNFAEMTRYGDRQFYRDWWNATTFEEFNRKWNQPVYHFLYKHVYVVALYKYKKSRKFAQLFTFFFSACLHEWVFSLVFRIIRPIMFYFMIQQIPLFFLTKGLEGTRRGNILFWWGLGFGMPLIGVLYLRSDPTVTKLFSKDEGL